MSNRWETFSHTQRNFDLSRPVPRQLELELITIAESARSNLLVPLFIKDPELIEFIYDQSVIPTVDSYKLEGYIARKNSQLMAPMLFGMLSYLGTDQSTQHHFTAGRVYSSVGLTALRFGCRTGFCICFENAPVEVELRRRGLISENWGFCSLPLLSIGYGQPDKEYNWCDDINRAIPGPEKQSADNYIAVI